MSKRRERYCRLRTMKQLRQERYKLRMRIENREAELMHDAALVKEKLSPGNLMGTLMDRLYCSSGLMRNILSGFGVARSFFGGRKHHTAGHHDDCGCE